MEVEKTNALADLLVHVPCTVSKLINMALLNLLLLLSR
jgi:hypothetical protein